MLDIDWTLGVALISVIIFLWLLNKILFQPLGRFMEAREHGIRSDLDEAARLRQQADAALTTYESALGATRREMAEQAAAVQRAMEAKQREIIEEARGRAGQMVAEAQATIGREVEGARAQLADQAQELARLVVAKLMGREAVR
ncbi:MAG TPA: ATP synthase F0 subunit B [Alphaproteobacteria bacterium]|nr:ATP synthase F0 subunit B [Alphaproteobacteria bacterium]